MSLNSHLSTCVGTQSPKYLEMAQGHISLSVTHLPRDGQSQTPLPRRRGRVTLRGLYKVPLVLENPLQFIGSSSAGIPRLTTIVGKSTQGPPYTDHSPTALAPFG
jgi:hypothetical protein